MKDNARAQSLPPSAVVSLVALETSCGALGSTQLRNKNMETSKTYFFSSSCLCVSGVSGRAVGGEENDFFLKYGRHRLRRRRGRNCGPPRKIILHVPQALDPEKNTSVSPTGATPPPTSGLFIQSVVVVGFQEEKSGKGNVEVEVSQMSRSRKKEQNVTSFPPSIATLSADSYSYLLLPGALLRRTPVPEEWRGIVKKRESKGRHVGRRNAAGTWSASYFGGSASSSSNCRRLCCFRWPALSFKSRASQI